MTTFHSHAPGTPSWVDLMSPDVHEAKEFYTSLFGWAAEDQLDDEGNQIYTIFLKNGKAVAGLGGLPPDADGMPATWNTYISVNSVDNATTTVNEAGGHVIMPPMKVMDAGSMAVFADPTGAVFSVWQPDQHIGVEIGNEPGSYGWNELMSRDIDTAKRFYSEVFGWTYHQIQMPHSLYNVIDGGDNGGLGGLMAMPDGVPDEVPSHWMVYFIVADLETSMARAEEGGGQTVHGPMDLPDVGTVAAVVDPTGGMFTMMQPAEQG